MSPAVTGMGDNSSEPFPLLSNHDSSPGEETIGMSWRSMLIYLPARRAFVADNLWATRYGRTAGLRLPSDLGSFHDFSIAQRVSNATMKGVGIYLMFRCHRAQALCG